MNITKLLPAFAALALSACVTGYGYSDDGYYYARPSASVSTYGGVGYGSGGWRSGYGMSYGYGYPGYYGYGPYGGYYDPYYGYYYPRPPIVIIHRPPGGHHGHDHDDDDHDGDHHNGAEPPPWRDLNNLGNRRPARVTAPDGDDIPPPRGLPPMARNGDVDAPQRVRTPTPPPSVPPRVRMPDPPSMPSRSNDSSAQKSDRRR